ncbi:MAG TPA: hypothetical protein DC012_03410 [Escherichia sp.]|nr:hypothetical protein [Escherichia sp.]
MFSMTRLIKYWCLFASIYTSLALGQIISDNYFCGSSIPWLVMVCLGCVMTWKIEKILKALS